MNRIDYKIIDFQEYKDRKKEEESIKELDRQELLELIRKVIATK